MYEIPFFTYPLKLANNMKAVIIFALLLTNVFALITIVYPIADSFLDSGAPNTNYGTSVDGYVFRDIFGNNAYFDLICTFNITNLPTTIISATVTYTQEYISVDEIFDAYLVHDIYEIAPNWTQSDVTWNNPPVKLRQTHTDYQDYDIESVLIPATTVYRDAKSASRTLISFLVHSSYSAVNVYMKESSILFRPTMTVVYLF